MIPINYLFFAAFVWQSVSGETGVINWIASSPQWLEYGQQATVNFSYSPPCKNIKFFKQGADSCCHFGRGCWWSPVLVPRAEVRSANEFVARNQTHIANGNYYAICTESVTLYKSHELFGKNNWNLAIGVKPKIFSIDYVGPNKETITFEKTKARGEVTYQAAVTVSAGKFTFVFGVGRGHNPNSTSSHEDFVFYVPEFEAANDDNQYGYSFIEKTEPEQFTPMPHYPDGYLYRYNVRRAKLIEHGVCDIVGTAIAAMDTAHMEQINFRLNITYDPLISSLTVEHYEFSDTGKWACVFTCSAGACPYKNKDLLYDWSIYSSEWPSYPPQNSTKPDHRVMRNQLLIDGDKCKSLYAESLSSPPHQISCRVTTPKTTWTEKSLHIKTLLGPIFGGKDEKQTQKPQQTDDAAAAAAAAAAGKSE